MKQLQIRNLTKCYGKNIVIKNLNCNFDSLKYNFLVGPNGTGKSTLIKCMLGYTSYQGKIFKEDLIFSYVPDKVNLPEYISVYNLLLLLLINKKVKIKEADLRINKMLDKFKIDKYRNVSINRLSKGTKQKVILIQGLIIEADIYIFDEPLSGLDKESRGIFVNEIRTLKKLNKVIIISTHHLLDYKFRNKNVIIFPIGSEVTNETFG